MSAPIRENPPAPPATFALTERDSPFDEVQSLPERISITREMACRLADNGLLPGRYSLHDGTLYTDPRRSERILITREMAYDLMDTHLLNGRWELIEGVILSKMGQNRPHATTLARISDWLDDVFGNQFVQSQQPIDITNATGETTEPEPDVAAAKQRIRDYTQRSPAPDDLHLVVEVADSTLRTDTVIKAKLYARAGIQEYWIADTNARTIIVHREPENETYRSIVTYTAEQTVACLAKPAEFKRVDELIAPASNEPPQTTEQ